MSKTETPDSSKEDRDRRSEGRTDGRGRHAG